MKRKISKKTGIIAEGKTKIIYGTDDPDIVLIENKDDLTKGDGKVRCKLTGKGILATITACNVFELLKKHDVPVAHIAKVNDRTFSAYAADMVGLEIVVRNIAFGSYLKRNPGVKEGKIFLHPVVEFYLKNDKEGDPLAVFDLISGQWLLFDAKKPVKEVICVMPSFVTKNGIVISEPIVKQIIEMAHQINRILKDSWEEEKVALVDFKFEVGFIRKNKEKGEGKVITLVLADVIDNDSWRIWFLGNKLNMLDKESFRIMKEVTKEGRKSLKKKYRWVAKATGLFLK